MYLFKYKLFKLFGRNTYQGHIDSYDGNSFYGWLVDASNPNKRQNVSVYNNDNLLKTVKTGYYREDLVGENINPKSGFILSLDKKLINHNIRFISESGFELKVNNSILAKFYDTPPKLPPKEPSQKKSQKKGAKVKRKPPVKKIPKVEIINIRCGILTVKINTESEMELIVKSNNEIIYQDVLVSYNKSENVEIDLADVLCDSKQHILDIIANNQIILHNFSYRSRYLHFKVQLNEVNNEFISGTAINTIDKNSYLKLELYVNGVFRKIYIADRINSESNNNFYIDLQELELQEIDTIRLECSDSYTVLERKIIELDENQNGA